MKLMYEFCSLGAIAFGLFILLYLLVNLFQGELPYPDGFLILAFCFVFPALFFIKCKSGEKYEYRCERPTNK